MAKRSNIFQILFLIFLFIAFGLGAYVYSTMDLRYMIARSEGMEPQIQTTDEPGSNQAIIPEGCPDLLVQRGTDLYLYDTRLPEEDGKNPVVFKSLDEYSAYLSKQDAKCPVLFLQQENNAQGQDVYRLRPSPFNPQNGVPAYSSMAKPYDGHVIKEIDASRENGFNQNMYPGFDPQGLYVGRNTNVDVVHSSTEKAVMSDNPMDPNWGGVLFTQKQVESGKYEGNEVTPTHYVTPKGGENLPIYGPSNPYP